MMYEIMGIDFYPYKFIGYNLDTSLEKAGLSFQSFNNTSWKQTALDLFFYGW